MHLFLLNFILLGVSSSRILADEQGFCSTTVSCIEKIKRLVPDTDSFWFGDQYKLQCGEFSSRKMRMQNPIKCYNPSDLVGFSSIGSRLFRVKTFTPAYLQNLKIFPRITFKTSPGNYHACGHDYVISPDNPVIEAHPEMEPIDPYLIRNEPEIDWPEMDKNDSLIIIMVDIGFGKLKFLSINFPRDTEVIQKYKSVNNFRYGMPNPMAVLVFRPNPGMVYSHRNFRNHPDAPFDLKEFMIKHSLENGLIGLNWVLVGADPFSIEKARLRNIADNCHFLIQKKLMNDQRWSFVESFPLNEMDTLMTVSFNQPEFRAQVCCSEVELEEGEVYVDPLSDTQLPSIAVISPPKVTSLRSVQQMEDNYQRSQRDYIVSKEDRFTLVMFDPKKSYLYWLVADIPSDYLASGDIIKDSLTIAKYLSPMSEKPNECVFIVLMLFRQPRSSSISEISEHYNKDHALRSSMCDEHCIYRSGFSIDQFKAFHRLVLSSTSWFKVCYDIYEASKQLKKIESSNVTVTTENIPRENGYTEILDNPHRDYFKKHGEKKRLQMQNICAIVKQTSIDCAKLSSTEKHSIQWFLIFSSLFICFFI